MLFAKHIFFSVSHSKMAEPEGKRTIRPLNLNIDQIRTAFAEEGCDLTTTQYRNSIPRLDYTYDGQP
jgi:hypothetical protein